MTVPHSNQYHPRAKRRVRDLAAEYADKVDSTLVSNTIHERVPEDEFVLELADVVERLDDLQERAGATDSELRSPLRTAMYHLTSDVDEAVVRKRVETVVDEILADLEEEVEEWDDAWSDEKIGEAKQEIRHIRETGDRCRTRGD
ncbi:hypothetical protein NP511_22670 (plasmid) [Natrinema thermotolerans]|uniref:Uncharacterized protein n=1 Tax=Natrinema thermotolerans TaxID=121872 RepID=A0AAF0PJH7_9EURY|nr:hypothetical protein [Natrinema thermotolerans]QCC57317.1 hypothetical protein DVR14_01160 [Natrinema thermotolerans]WMT10340.1 hypothetical protein NP511_22670 [Natrinema thermotolerans]